MKGSVFVLLACFALFAAPSHSYSASEGDQLASRQDTQSGSPSTDAATPGDAVVSTNTTGESKPIKMDGDANPRDESVAGDAQAEKSKIRKRDTSVWYDYDYDTEEKPSRWPISKEWVLHEFRELAKYGGECFGKAFNYIEVNELPKGFVEEFFPESFFTWSDLTKWLEIVKDNVSDCLILSAGDVIAESNWLSGPTRPKDTFGSIEEVFSPLKEVGKMLMKSMEDAIKHLVAIAPDPGDTVQRSSESLPDLLMKLVNILSVIEGKAVPAGGTVPMLPPGQTAAPYLIPAVPTSKKRNSLDKPRGYRNRSKSPRYVYDKGTPDSIAPQSSGFRGGEMQVPHSPGMTTLPEEGSALPSQQLSLLNIVLGKIYSRLQGEVSPAVGKEAAPVEGLRVNANGALYPGNGESPAVGNPECVQRRRVQ